MSLQISLVSIFSVPLPVEILNSLKDLLNKIIRPLSFPNFPIPYSLDKSVAKSFILSYGEIELRVTIAISRVVDFS